MKSFFVNLKNWFINHAPSKRRLIQIYAALLYNANIKGFVQGRIFTGGTKNLCVPGLNCYSCPGAVAACPLGALQNAMSASDKTAPYYIIGILALFCIILGRTICGFLCPVGLGQELLYKIKTPKLKKNRVTRVLSYLKYIILVVMVVILPILLHSPTFCKYICPAGTFGGGLGLLIHPENGDFFDALASLFTWKFALMVAIIVLCIFCFRAFCRFLCPLGALYGLFNRIALIGVTLDESKCTDCGLCLNHCKMDINRVGDHECIECGECIAVCPTHAISWKGSKIFLHPNMIEAAEKAEVAATEDTNAPSLVSVLNGGTANENSPVEQTLTLNMESDVLVEEAEPAEQQESEKSKKQKKVKTKKTPLTAAQVIKRNKILEIVAWSLAGVILIGALVYYNFIFDGKKSSLSEGDICSDFTLQAYNGKETYSLADSKGKVVVINFWATWCPGCIEELPDFNVLQENYAEDVTVVAVHGTEVTEDVQAFINDSNWDKYSLTFIQDDVNTELKYYEAGVKQESETTGQLYSMLGGKGAWPMTVILDREGKISVVWQNTASYETLEKMVLPLINAE